MLIPGAFSTLMLTPGFQVQWDICKLNSFTSHSVLNMPHPVKSQDSDHPNEIIPILTTNWWWVDQLLFSNLVTWGISRPLPPWDYVVFSFFFSIFFFFSDKLCSLVLTCLLSILPSSFPSPLQPLTHPSLFQLCRFPVSFAYLCSDQCTLSNLVHIHGSKKLCILLTIYT